MQKNKNVTKKIMTFSFRKTITNQNIVNYFFDTNNV